MAAQAFERAEERRLLAADVSARAGVRVDVAREVRAEDFLAEEVRRARLFERLVHDLDEVAILAARVDVVHARAEGVGGDEHALDEQVRVALHQVAVFEGARLRLIGVADDVAGLRRVLRHEAPLHPRGEARAAATAQGRLLDLADHIVRRHAVEDFLQRLVAAVLAVHVERARPLKVHAPQLQWLAADGPDKHKDVRLR